MQYSEMITIGYIISSFTGDIFHDLVANLTPWMRYNCTYDPILILYKVFIKLGKGLFSNLS